VKAKLTESAFQAQVIQLARLHKWRVAHFRKVRVQRRNGSTYYETPIAADGVGFPDLVLVHRAHGVLFAELKVGKNKPTAEQVQWLDDLGAAGVRAVVWRPEDWGTIEDTLGGKA
jgi:hypothetical protein